VIDRVSKKYPELNEAQAELLGLCPFEFTEPEVPFANWFVMTTSTAENWGEQRGYELVGYSVSQRKGNEVVTFWLRKIAWPKRFIRLLRQMPKAIASIVFGGVVSSLSVCVLMLILILPIVLVVQLLVALLK
jgi:hypothetical protein